MDETDKIHENFMKDTTNKLLSYIDDIRASFSDTMVYCNP